MDLSGFVAVDAEWLAYLGSFRYLRVLKLADCKNVTNHAVWALSGMSLKYILELLFLIITSIDEDLIGTKCNIMV